MPGISFFRVTGAILIYFTIGYSGSCFFGKIHSHTFAVGNRNIFDRNFTGIKLNSCTTACDLQIFDCDIVNPCSADHYSLTVSLPCTACDAAGRNRIHDDSLSTGKIYHSIFLSYDGHFFIQPYGSTELVRSIRKVNHSILFPVKLIPSDIISGCRQSFSHSRVAACFS